MSAPVFSLNPAAPDPALLKAAAEIICRGGVAVIPTDTLYGLGVVATAEADLEQLYQIKKRDASKAIPLLVGGSESQEILGSLAVEVPEYAVRLVRRYWPGPLTLVVRASDAVAPGFRANDGSVALRMPDSPVALALLSMLEVPLATSSANISGRSPATTVEQLDSGLVSRVSCIIDAGPAAVGQPSTIVSCLGEQPLIIREGALCKAQLW